MFDIGVNLTSTQFAADRQKVVKRARDAGVTGMLITGTNGWRASRLSDWLKLNPASAGLLRAFTLTMPANGPRKSPAPCVGWLKNRKW